MIFASLGLAFILGGVGTGGSAASWLGASLQDPSVSEKETRRRIEQRIDEFRKSGRPLGPGLLRESVSDTLAFGVPAFNSGDHESCARFYVKTAESLLAAFPEGRPRTVLGERALADLRQALGRARAAPDADGQAWAIRFGFDKILIAWEGTVARGRALVGLGSQNFAGGRYAESADAFHEAAELLEDVVGDELSQVDLGLRGASFMCGHACLAQGRWAEAARALEAGYRYVPDFPKGNFDLRTQFRADRFEEILSQLAGAVEEHPKDADLAFLLGYVHFHGGKKAEGRAWFEKALQLSPSHAGARRYAPEGPPAKRGEDF